MNKKLIAAAVSAAIVAPVAAYGEVTVYGRINNAIDINDLDDSADADSTTDLSGVSSRFGIKYNKEMGNGLSAHGHYEFAISTDNEDGGGTDNRVATVGLSGPFGRIDAGNQWSSYFNTFGTLVSPTYSLGFYVYSSVGGGLLRSSNTIKYSNSFGPLHAELDVRLDDGGDEVGDAAEPAAGDGIGLGLSWAITDNITIAAAWDNEDGADRDAIKAIASRPQVGMPELPFRAAVAARTATEDDVREADTAYTLLDPVDFKVIEQVAAVAAIAVGGQTDAVAERAAAEETDNYRPKREAVAAQAADEAPDADRFGIAIKATLGNYWASLGFQNYEVDDDSRTNTDVDIDSTIFYVGGSIGEKTSWLVGYSEADDGRDAVAAKSNTVLDAADVTRINAATPAGIPDVAVGDQLDDATKAVAETDDTEQLTWGIYHNLGGGLKIYYEGTAVDNENNEQDGARHYIGMRVDF